MPRTARDPSRTVLSCHPRDPLWTCWNFANPYLGFRRWLGGKVLISRRRLVSGATLTGAVLAARSSWARADQSASQRADLKAGVSAKAFVPPQGPRSRIMIVNDLSGDIDGLFA